jgi:hypothetical protein
MMAFLTREENAMFYEDHIDAGDLPGRLFLRMERDNMLDEDETARHLRKEQQQPSLEKERLAMRIEDAAFRRRWEWYQTQGLKAKAAARRAMAYCKADAFKSPPSAILDPHHVIV